MITINREWELVRQFHEKFNHPTPPSFPQTLSESSVQIRGKWLQEELDEFYEAENIYEQADAMIDLIYFALGTMVEMGLKPNKIFDVVHNANMAKLWDDGRPHYDRNGKVVKPNGWKDPERLIRAIIDEGMVNHESL